MSAKARSPSGKTAWGDYGSARPDPQFDFGQEPIRDDADLSPTAMEGDDSVYMGGDRNKSAAVATTSKNQSKSCFAKIGHGIRSLWATRQTEDVKGDRELHVKTTLRELIIYIVFLVILCIVTFGMTQTTMYYYTKVMSDLFLDKTHSSGGSFRTITSVEDFWKFAKGPLVSGLYWETWYNNATVPEGQEGYIYYENKLLGVPRLRQLQVHSNSCVVHDDFKNVIRECYESYSESLENKQSFGEAITTNDNHTGWYYQTQDELDGSSHWGKIATYSGAGYVQDLTQNKSESAALIDYLFDKRWIRRGTRVLFIDFTVYNANINLFCVIRLTVEFPPTGGAIPHATMRTVKLIRYVTVMDYFIMACEFILCLFIFYYMVEEAIEIKKHKFSYFKSVWNILDILVIVIALVCVAFNVYRTLKVDELLKKLLDKPDQYADFEFLSYGQTQFDNAIAIAVFLAWIKIFKYISFNKTMTQLSSTLGKCAKDLAGFAVMFFIIFLAFTQLGYLLFGTQVKDFSNFQNSFFTLFRIILGDFDFDQLEAANRVLGPIFFMLFVFFVFFVLINMFLAIINDTYSEVKGDMANQKNEFEMGDYFKRGYEKMLNKLNFKHDKIVDIQKALQSADINNDQQVDFDEWRQDLKTRGYADGEIEALFAKYDMDGDRVLDKDEQRKMQADLAHQRDALKKEYDELDKIDRPESARRSTSRVSFNDDSADDSDDEDSHTKSSRSGPSQSVSYEEFTVLSRRVDRMEHSIGSIVSKIDAVLVKLEAMEKAKLKRRETMGKILDSITESDGTSDEVKREQMERLVREELERWDSESSITPQPSASGRGASPISSGPRSRSRPASGGNPQNQERVSCGKKQFEETVDPLISETLLVEEMPENDNRLDQTEHVGLTCAETRTSVGDCLYPPISVFTCNETITSIPCPEPFSKTLHNSFTIQNSDDSFQVISTSGMKGEKIDLRPNTPILPGIPSASYQKEQELSLPKSSSDKNFEGDTSAANLSSCVTETIERDIGYFSQLSRPSSKLSDRSNDLISKSDRNVDSNARSFRQTSKSSDINDDPNIKSSKSKSVSSDKNDDQRSSRPTSKSSDRTDVQNAMSPSSKSSDRNIDQDTMSPIQTPKPSDHCDDSKAMSSSPATKSSDRNIAKDTMSSEPSLKISNQNDDLNGRSRSSRPSSKSSDRNDDRNTRLSRPSSKSSERNDDSNTRSSRPNSKSSDRNDDPNTRSSRSSSKSSDRNDDSNTRSSRPNSGSSNRNDEPNSMSSRPNSKSSERNDDSNTMSSRPNSKSFDRNDDQNTLSSKPSSKSSDRNDDLNSTSSRPSSKCLNKSDNPNTRLSRPTSKSSNRNDDPNTGLSRPSSKCSDRNDDPNTRSSRPNSGSSNRNDDPNSMSSRPSSKSSERNDDSNTIPSRPNSKSSDRNDDQNTWSSRPNPKSSDKNYDTNTLLSRPSSKSSDRNDDPKSRSSRPVGSVVKSNDSSKAAQRFPCGDNESKKLPASNDLQYKMKPSDVNLQDNVSDINPIASVSGTPILGNIQTNSEIPLTRCFSENESHYVLNEESMSLKTNIKLINLERKSEGKLDENKLTGKDELIYSDAIINEEEDLNQVNVENDIHTMKIKQIEPVEAGEIPETIVTAKGQKVSRGTLSKMAGKRKSNVQNTNPQTGLADNGFFDSNISHSGETIMTEKDFVKNCQAIDTKPVKVGTLTKMFSVANEKSFQTNVKEGKRKEMSKSPSRSTGAVSNSLSVNISEEVNNEKHGVLQEKATSKDRDSKTLSLPAIDCKASKQGSVKQKKLNVKEVPKVHLTSNIANQRLPEEKLISISKSNIKSTFAIVGQKPFKGKRHAPTIPAKQGANTGSLDAHGEGSHKSESKVHDESAVFV